MNYRIIIFIGLLAMAGVLAAQSSHQNHNKHHGDHAKHHGDHSAYHANTPALNEAGQGAFAAIAEVIAQLEADPETDWSKVNINALRQHLQDMHFLMLYANADQQKTDNGWQFTITGEGKALDAIKRMVPMHAGELNNMEGLSAATKSIENGVQLTMGGDNQTMQDKIGGLGFFGLMALGSHHQIHHYHMASGFAGMKH